VPLQAPAGASLIAARGLRAAADRNIDAASSHVPSACQPMQNGGGQHRGPANMPEHIQNDEVNLMLSYLGDPSAAGLTGARADVNDLAPNAYDACDAHVSVHIHHPIRMLHPQGHPGHRAPARCLVCQCRAACWDGGCPAAACSGRRARSPRPRCPRRRCSG
jgi:hypothetical protein